MKRILIFLAFIALLATPVSAQKIPNQQLADQTAGTVKGRALGAGTGSPQDLTATQVLDLLGISAFVRTLLDDADAATFRASIGVSAGGGVMTVGGSAPIVSSGGTDPMISLSNTAVTPGSYTNTDLTVDAQGRITAATSGSTSGYTDEMAQDAVGPILTDTATIDHTYNDATPSITSDVKTDSIGNTLLANVPTATFKGRTTAATGDPEDLTVAQAKTLLNLTGTNSGDQTITLTSDVTGTGTGSFATTIAADAVTNTKLANMAQSTIKGRAAAAGTGDPTDLTAAQVATIINSSLDHGTLAGLSGDDHTQYALLAGRAAGQTLNGGTAAGDDLVLASTTNATKGYTIINSAGGSVGVGTTTPARPLHVVGAPITVGSAKTQLAVESTEAYNATPVAGLDFRAKYNVAGGLADLGAITSGTENAVDGDYSGYLALHTRLSGLAPAERMRIDSTGNVGIGTASPSNKLSVTGSIDATLSTTSPLSVNVVNVNTGTAAFAGFVAANAAGGTNDSLRLLALSSGYTASGFLAPDTAVLQSGSGLTGGLTLGTGAGDIRFFTAGSGTQRMNIDSTGPVSVYNNFDTTLSTNGTLSSSVVNANAGSSTIATVRAMNSATEGVVLQAYGTAYSTAGIHIADSGAVYSDPGLANGLSIGALGSSSDLRFFAGGAGSSNNWMTINSNGNIATNTLQIHSVKSLSVPDNVSTVMVTINTTNEAGSTDGGGWTATVTVGVFEGATSGSGAGASKQVVYQTCRVMEASGTGVGSAPVLISASNNAAIASATRDIGTVTVQVFEVTEYSVTINITADFTGTTPITGVAVVSTELLYSGFVTPPTLN